MVRRSGTAPYDGTRAFYRRLGYSEHARVPDHWTDGDDPRALQHPALTDPEVGVRDTGPVPPAAPVTAASPYRLRVGACGAALLALGYAGVSAYWTLGGTALLSTVGGPLEDLARRPTAAAVALGAAVTAAELLGAALGLALVQPWGRRLPQRPLVRTATAAAVVLTVYGGLLVAVGALALVGLFGPPPADPTALRWHVLVWDLWFLLWGLLLGTAARHRRLLPSGPCT